MGLSMKVIDSTAALTEFCHSLQNREFITIDLEFLREKTYYAKLCLIQVGAADDAAVIDPLAEGLDLSPFVELLKNPGITKVFHSGRQDIEILYMLTGFIPEPLFDTQIAAMVCGYGDSVSYETLVKKICDVELDKSSRLSNWSIRPLDKSQLCYALSDVTHLVNVYQALREQLRLNGRIHWLDEEAEILKNPETYTVNPQDAWQKIKHRSHNPKMLTILKELAAWRESRAQRKDTPRQNVIKDDLLLNIAALCPTSIEELEQIRNMRKEVATGKLGNEIIEVLNAARQIPASQYVKLPKERPLPQGAAGLHELLKLLLKLTSQESGVVAKLIASDDDLKRFATFKDRNNPILKGWRKELFGNRAIELRNGKLSIRYDNIKHCVSITPVADVSA